MKVNFVDLKIQYDNIKDEISKNIDEVMSSTGFILGLQVEKFEERFAKFCQTKYAIGVASGTDAIILSLKALGIAPGDEVITTSNTFIATALGISHTGAVPIFVDCVSTDYNINPAKIEAAITSKTRAIMPVHLYGQMANMDVIMNVAEKYNLKVIEDACQAHGAIYRKERVGSIGDVGCFSFYPSKNMSVLGDGGMITTDNADIANTAIKLRNSGRTAKYEHDIIGYTARLNSINAAIGRIQLQRLDEWNKKRTLIAKQYFRELKELEELIKFPPQGSPYITPVFHLFVIRTEQRDALQSWLEKTGIECGVYYQIPIPLQPVYRNLYGFKEGDFPVSERYGNTCLSLPMHPNLKIEDVHFICEQIKTFHSNS